MADEGKGQPMTAARDAIEWALHDKLFAMNGYKKLPHALQKLDEVVDEVVEALTRAGLSVEQGWREIGPSTPKGRYLLFFPATKSGQWANTPTMKVDTHPVCTPRQPSHYMPLPAPPDRKE